MFVCEACWGVQLVVTHQICLALVNSRKLRCITDNHLLVSFICSAKRGVLCCAFCLVFLYLILDGSHRLVIVLKVCVHARRLCEVWSLPVPDEHLLVPCVLLWSAVIDWISRKSVRNIDFQTRANSINATVLDWDLFADFGHICELEKFWFLLIGHISTPKVYVVLWNGIAGGTRRLGDCRDTVSCFWVYREARTRRPDRVTRSVTIACTRMITINQAR